MHLHCIRTFKAYTRNGEAHVIGIWTQFGTFSHRKRARANPDPLVLVTTDGQGVERIAQGKYRLTDKPEVSLTSDDPNAP